ncbi:MAG: thiol reductant ABC exporter subunit CydC [Actinomycetales bacterium]
MSTARPAPAVRRPLVETLHLLGGLWPRLLLAALAGAAALGSGVALTATSAWLISRAAQHPPVLDLMVAIVAVRAFGLARGFCRYAERLLSHDAAFRALSRTRVLLYSALEGLTPVGIGAYRSGDLLARLVDDVDAIQDLYLRVAVPVAAGTAVGLGAVVGLGWAAPAPAAALAVGLVVVGVVLPAWATRAAARATELEIPARRDLSVATMDALLGSADLLACGADRSQLDRVAGLDDRLLAAARSDRRTAAVNAVASSLATGATVVACLVLGAQAVRAGGLPGELLATVVLTPLATFEAVSTFPAAAQQLGRVRASAARVLEVLHRAPPAASVIGRQADPPRPPLQIELRHLSARWPGADRPALRDIDLRLASGSRTAVVGPSGSGKSTLVAVLLGFLPPVTGQVMMNGQDAASLDEPDLRRLIGCCSQEAHIFDASIADNVRIGRPGASEQQVRRALDRAGLLSWVTGLPDGSAAWAGEHGGRLSGGQRQRLALARELLADRPVVLLDEPTEHLEESMAADLVRDLLRAVRDRTTLIVTHQLAGLDSVEEIVVLNGGRIVQRGTHEQLLTECGWYRDAWLTQH